MTGLHFYLLLTLFIIATVKERSTCSSLSPHLSRPVSFLWGLIHTGAVSKEVEVFGLVLLVHLAAWLEEGINEQL